MKKMEENSIWIWVAAVLGIVAGGWLVKHLIGPVDPIDIEEEYADDEIAFDDMVGYFKSLHLKREDGICSIVSDKHKKYHKILFKTGYTSLGLFVLNEENGQIVKGKIIHAKSFDSKTFEAFNGHDIIKLA